MKPVSLLLLFGAVLSCNPPPAIAGDLSGDIVAAGGVSNITPIGAKTPPPPATTSAQDLAVWRAAYITQGRSALLGQTADAVEYAVGGTLDLRPNNRVRAWMRWEAYRPMHSSEGDVRSYTELMEVDCGDQRARLLAMDTFPFNNLQGPSRHHDSQDPQWAYPRPNSALEGEIKALCGVRDLAILRLAAAAAAAQKGEGVQPGVSTLALAQSR